MRGWRGEKKCAAFHKLYNSGTGARLSRARPRWTRKEGICFGFEARLLRLAFLEPFLFCV